MFFFNLKLLNLTPAFKDTALVTKNFTLRTPEDSLTSKYILYLLKQKNFKNFE